MGEEMNDKYKSIKNIFVPNKKLNIFITIILFFGLTSGAIFSTLINRNDTNTVVERIKLFISNINGNSLNSITVLKESLSINLIYLIIIFFLGITIVGIIINIIISYLKGFILGFSLSSFIITYKYRGIALSLLYLIFGQLLNTIVVIIISTYSILLSSILISLIFKNNKRNELRVFVKKYLLVFLMCLIITIISSVSEAFILPSLIKLIIKLYL